MSAARSMRPRRHRLLRLLAGLLFGLGGATLFLLGAISLTSAVPVAGVVPPTLAICAGVVAATSWFVVSLVKYDAVKARPRRRPR